VFVGLENSKWLIFDLRKFLKMCQLVRWALNARRLEKHGVLPFYFLEGVSRLKP
jgi:hypothetical protein